MVNGAMTVSMPAVAVTGERCYCVKEDMGKTWRGSERHKKDDGIHGEVEQS
jgi:hypothetical protein